MPKSIWLQNEGVVPSTKVDIKLKTWTRFPINVLNLMEDGCKPKKEICRSCVHMSYHHYDKIGKCLRMVHELSIFNTRMTIILLTLDTWFDIDMCWGQSITYTSTRVYYHLVKKREICMQNPYFTCFYMVEVFEPRHSNGFHGIVSTSSHWLVINELCHKFHPKTNPN